MTSTNRPATVSRRRALQASGAALAALAAPALVRAQTPKIRIGYWPIAAGLPFYSAVELGYFKDAGLDVEVQRYAGAQQIMEAMLSGRSDGSANGTGSANIAIGELASPGTFKLFCSNPSNAKNVLDEVLVPAGSPAKTIADLKGKKVLSGPGIQNTTLAKTVLERGGATGATVTELPIGQHVAALAAGQADACYTLEPTGTIGRMKGATRTLEAGVIARYILGDPMAPWFGGSASLTSGPSGTARYSNPVASSKSVSEIRTAPAIGKACRPTGRSAIRLSKTGPVAPPVRKARSTAPPNSAMTRATLVPPPPG